MQFDDIYTMTVLIFVIAHGRVALAHAVPGIDFSREQAIRDFVDAMVGGLVYQTQPLRT
jgi:hypothetical protein